MLIIGDVEDSFSPPRVWNGGINANCPASGSCHVSKFQGSDCLRYSYNAENVIPMLAVTLAIIRFS